MTTPLPVNIDSTYADSGTDASVALHQQYHDRLHTRFNGTAISAEEYGASGDAKNVTDAAATAASATITSATAAFVSTDVGKAVILLGAGAGGVTLRTTIATYVSATSVTLAVTASTTVTAKSMWFGTDAYTPLANALTAIGNKAAGAELVIPPGKYLLYAGGQLTVPKNCTIRGAGDATVLLVGNWSASSVLRAAGTLPDDSGTATTNRKTSLSANTTAGDNAVSLTSLTGINPDEYYLLGDTSAQTSENPLRYQGEFIRVRATPSNNPFGTNGTPAAGTVNLHGAVRDVYKTTATGGIWGPVLFLTGVMLRDFKIQNTDPLNTVDPHTSTGGIRLEVCQGATISGVRVAGMGATAITIQNCLDVLATDCHLHDAPDLNNYLSSSSPPAWYGYGVDIERASENIRVTDCTAERMRHGITTDGLDNLKGVPRHIKISGCTIRNCTDFGIDTHAPTADAQIIGNVVDNCPGGGIEIRGQNCGVISNTITWCSKGIQIKPDSHGTQILNNSIRHCILSPSWTNQGNTASYGVGIFINTSASIAPDHLIIRGNTIDAIDDLGIQIGGGGGKNPHRLKILYNVITNTGLRNPNAASRAEGIYNSNTSGTASAWQVVGNLFGSDPGAGGTGDNSDATFYEPHSSTGTTGSQITAINFAAGSTYANCHFTDNRGISMGTALEPTFPAGWTANGNAELSHSVTRTTRNPWTWRGDLIVGRIKATQGAAPTVAAGAASTSPPAPVVVAGSSDTAGRITFGSGTSPAIGIYVTVTFSATYTTAPTVVIAPANSATAIKSPYVVAASATAFTIGLGVAAGISQANTVYDVAYHTL